MFGRHSFDNLQRKRKRIDGSDDVIDKSRLTEIARASINGIAKRQKVTETRKFAGQSVRCAIVFCIKINELIFSFSSVQLSLPVSAAEADNTDTSKGGLGATSAGSALDQVLDVLKGPKVVSTVAKSSYDWDSFKEKEGLEDELAVAAKEG